MGAGERGVALRAGGALETVLDGATGVLFDAPTVESLVAAIERSDAMTFDRHAIRAHAERFPPVALSRQAGERQVIGEDYPRPASRRRSDA